MEVFNNLGKSGYLPDISSSFSFYRAFAINSLQNKDWRGAAAALYNINSLLTEDYVITINSAEYEKQTKESFTYQCSFCEEFTPKQDLLIWDKSLNVVDSLILSQEKISTWRCPKCYEDSPIEGTIITHEKSVMPFYRKVVPEPPMAGPGLLVRFTWQPAFRNWFFKFLEQLTHQLALYRIEYMSQHGEDMQEPIPKDPGESI